MEKERIKNVIKGLSLDEKLALCSIGISLRTAGSEKQRIFSADLGAENFYSARPLLAAGCTFDRELLFWLGSYAAAKADADGRAVSAKLNLGVIRSPMDGGAEKMASEDPVAVKCLAESFISGAGKRVFARIGDGFADRYFCPRALNEIYLYPLINLGKKLGGVIVPVGAANGKLCAESKPFINLIKSALGDGAPIIAQAYGVKDYTACVAAGTAVGIGLSDSGRAAAKRAVKLGTLAEGAIDSALFRLVSFVAEYFEDKKKELPPRFGTFDAQKILAEKSIVLLKNDGVLPIKSEGRNALTENNILLLRHDGNEFDAQSKKLLYGADIKSSVVVLIAPRPVELGELMSARAILFVPEELPHTLSAAEDIICGKLNPSGKLSVTWAEKKSDYPAYLNVRAAARGDFRYESVYNGYRYFSSFGKSPAFPFGHGLSYSRFAVSKPKISVSENGDVSADFTVENISGTSGETVVFAFAESDCKSVYGIKKRLIGFTRVKVGAGEKQPAHISADGSALAVFDDVSGEFAVPNGKYTLLLCFSAAETAAEADFKIKRGIKTAGGETPKSVPSYFGEKDFSPSGTEIEKIMKTPLIAKSPDYAEFIFSGENSPKAVKAAVKRLKKLGVEVEPSAFCAYPKRVSENIADAD